jgi:tripartite-type tricarboxylate transporter receptor subunit TctC
MNLASRVSVLLTTLVLTWGSALAQNYPQRPIRLIVPFAPGGPTDTIARIVAPRLGEALQQQIIIDNRAGAGGNIGMGLAANATADGYTLVLVSSSFVVNPGLYSKIPYDPAKSFAPISNWAAMPNVFVAHPSVPAKTLADVVKLVQSEGKKYASFATPGIGTTPDLSVALLKLTLKLDLTNVPYNGAGPAVAATVANQVPLGCMAMPGAAPHILAGRLRALAVTSPKRAAILPDVPTMAELGYKGQEADTIQALLAPAGTPDAIVQRLYRESARILGLPEVRSRIAGLGYEILASTPAELSAQIRTEVEKWRSVVKQAGIKVE